MWSQKLLILIDLDNTIVDVNSALKKWAATKSDIPIDETRTTEYNVDLWHPTLKLSQAFEEPGFFLNLKPYPDALEAIIKLAKIHNVVICSSPNSHIYAASAQEKTQWIRENLPVLDGKNTTLILCDDKTLIYADYLIDDNPYILEHGLNPNVSWKQVFYLQNYNKQYAYNNLYITNWTDLINLNNL
jgi:5'(3')-deoxyribonucleotidase